MADYTLKEELIKMAVVYKDRQIFEVHAVIVDATGARNVLSGFPKIYDSKNSQFDNDIDACLQRAEAEAHKTFGDMLMVTTRQLQTVILQTVDGRQILKLSKGQLAQVEAEIPDPEPDTPEPDTPSEGEEPSGEGE